MTSPARRRRPMPRDDGGDFEVGYAKPPRHTRFKRGQSGNPRGRPSEKKNLSTVLEDALAEAVVAVVGKGRSKKNHQVRGDHHPACQQISLGRSEGHSAAV